MWFKSSFTIPTVAAISYCLIGPTAPAVADILHVPGDFPTIQGAIDVAVDGDWVVVQPGTYNEAIDFLGKAIRVFGADGPDVTIIDAQQTGSVVTCDSAEGPDSVLEGFTITGGEAGSGGGMRNSGSDPTVTDCIFTGNTATSGGGMRNFAGSPTVTNCTFSENSAIFGGGMSNSGGGSPTVTNCAFLQNTAEFRGGGMTNILGSPAVTDCTFNWNTAGISGGGMENFQSNPTLTDCTFQGNTADGTDNNTGGGGMFNDGGIATVTGCTFDGNTATQSGGAMLNFFASTTVTDCEFTGNTALGDSSDGGGAIFTFVEPEIEVSLVNCDFSENQGFLGGAVCFAAFESDVDPVTLIDCSFTNNTATVGVQDLGGHGGAVYIFDVGAILIDCVLVANQALQTGEPSKGGGIINGQGGSSMLINCAMSGNTASLGGAIHIWGALSSFSLLNSTLSENTALESGGGIWTEGSSGAIANSIVWGNSDAGGSDESAQIHLADGDVAVDYSCIEGLRSFPGVGNIDADPMLVAPENGDFRLSPGSPCIDGADNSAVPKGIETDLDSNPRFIEDPNTPDTGLGVCPIVDMGSYEFQEGTTDCCPADLNDDGLVGASDLLIVLAFWGPCKGCPADFDGDGNVGASDLLTLLANWGPCP